MSRSHPLVPSVQNLYRSLSERSQSSWLLTCTRMWTSQKNDLRHGWLPETTGQWGRGPQRPQVARRHSRPRLPGTCSARFLTKGNDSHFHQTNSGGSIWAISFLELMKPCHLQVKKNIHPTKCLRHLDVFGELGSAKASWDQRVCFFRPHLPKIPLTAHTYNVSKHYEENYWD